MNNNEFGNDFLKNGFLIGVTFEDGKKLLKWRRIFLI
jgi:hypothetical protein